VIFQAVKNRVSVEGFAVQLRTAGGLMLLAAAAVLISACAPVVSVNERIPKGVEAKDLLTVRLATEGMAYSNQGRLVDAVGHLPARHRRRGEWVLRVDQGERAVPGP